MQYTKTLQVLHNGAPKTVFGHGHTRGSFLSLEPSLLEPREEPGYETSWVIYVVAGRLPALQTASLTQHKWSVLTAEGQARLALTPAIRSYFSVFSRRQKRTLCREVAKVCSKGWSTQTLTIFAETSAWATTPLSFSRESLSSPMLKYGSDYWARVFCVTPTDSHAQSLLSRFNAMRSMLRASLIKYS